VNKFDVVIIGSGISSLTCAALLSKKGKSVCVLEQYNKPGGYLHCFNRFGDRFDTGAHYVGAMDKGQPFHTLLNYLGVYDDSLFVPLDPDGFDVLKFPKLTVELPKGYAETISRLSSVFPSEKDGISRFFRKIQEVAKLFPTYEFNESRDVLSILDLLEMPLSKVVKECASNPQLQTILYSYCALHGVDAEEVSFGMHSIVTDSLIRGPYGFAKGGEALAKNYVDLIEKHGGVVLLKKRVATIEAQNKVATAVTTTDGDRYEGSWIISGIHPKQTFALVTEQKVFSPAFRERLKNTKESGGIFGIYAACHSQPTLNPLKNYYYFASDKPNDMLKAKTPDTKPNTVFLSPANRLAQGTKNAFTMNIHASGPMEWFESWRETKFAKRPDPYQNVKKEYAENIFSFIDQFEIGLSSTIEKYVTSTPVTNMHFNGSVDGSSYGIYHSIENTGARALGPRTHVSNLLLTGQSCLFPGLLGSAISALRTAGHIVGIKPMLKELRESAL
jgi:all-trans-retinol 13,14-reductase